MKQSHILTVYALFISIITIYVIMAMMFPFAYIWATYEDLVGEWAQFYFFLLALITSVRIALSFPAYRRFFTLLSFACLYVILEEISWGQRIFGWESPDYFKSQNLQGETNLHNMVTGPYSTSIKAAVTYILAGGLVAYGLIYQLSMRDEAYSLGKTYALLGEDFLAFKEFEKSFTLNPTKKKFRKAYYKAKKKMTNLRSSSFY